jgi:hypothetical protein
VPAGRGSISQLPERFAASTFARPNSVILPSLAVGRSANGKHHPATRPKSSERPAAHRLHRRAINQVNIRLHEVELL